MARRHPIAAALGLLAPAPSRAEPIAVAHRERLAHGFLSLRALDGTVLADGDLLQTSRGDRVTTRVR